MTGDIWGLLGKKKSTNMLTIPSKKTTNTSNNTTASSTTQTTATVQPVKVKPPEVRPHKKQKVKVQQHAHQATAPQQPQLNISNFKLATTGDASGVHIHALHNGNPIHKFSLLRSDYQLWQRMSPQQKYDFVKLRINHATFGHDMQIINAIIITTCQVLNTLFAQAQAQQAQAHKNMI